MNAKGGTRVMLENLSVRIWMEVIGAIVFQDILCLAMARAVFVSLI
jgi:hypothetical protein